MIAKRIFNLIFALTFSCSTAFAVPQPQAAAMPDLNISQDQMQKMDTMMHEMQNFYENLSAEEKAQFEKELATEVEKEQKKLEAMAPAAQKQYIETAFKAFDDISIEDLIEQLGDSDSNGSSTSIPDKPIEKDAIKSKDSEKAENKKKIKETLDLINNIIKVLNSLTSKLNSVKPSAQDLIDKWIKKGYIQGISSWKIFNTDLQTMKQKLEKLKQADPSTGKYYYLDNIKTVEKLYGQLEMLYSTIKKYEPSVEITASGLVKNEAAKSALTKLINSLADTTKTITKSIDDIVSKFTKESAPKIKKQEEDKAKKAERKPTARGKTSHAGTEIKEENDYKAYSVDSTPSYYGPTYSSGSNYGSSYGSGDLPDNSLTSASNKPATSSNSGIGKTPENSGVSSTSSPYSGAEKKKDDLVNAGTSDQKKSPDLTEQQKLDSSLATDKELEGKYKSINRMATHLDEHLDNLKDSYDQLCKNNKWSSDENLLKYLKGSAEDKEFEKEINSVAGKAKLAYESTEELVKTANENIKEPHLRNAIKEKSLKFLKDNEKTEEAIKNKLKGLAAFTHDIKDAAKKKLVETMKEFQDSSKIKAQLSEIK